jgi:hypothetical protein
LAIQPPSADLHQPVDDDWSARGQAATGKPRSGHGRSATPRQPPASTRPGSSSPTPRDPRGLLRPSGSFGLRGSLGSFAHTGRTCNACCAFPSAATTVVLPGLVSPCRHTTHVMAPPRLARSATPRRAPATARCPPPSTTTRPPSSPAHSGSLAFSNSDAVDSALRCEGGRAGRALMPTVTAC